MDTDNKPFVGYCRLALVDTDGLPKLLKGCNVECPLHLQEREVPEKGTVKVLTACLSREDPIDFLRLGFDDTELLTGRWVIGSLRKTDEHVNPNRVICSLETIPCNKLSTLLNETSSSGRVSCQATMRMLPDAFDRPVEVTLHTVDYKLTTRVVKIEVTIPNDMFEEWRVYHDALKEYEKENDKDKKKANQDVNDEKCEIRAF